MNTMDSTYTNEGDSPVWKTEPESPPHTWGIELLGDVELWGDSETPWKEDPWKSEDWNSVDAFSQGSPEGSNLSSGEEILEDIEGIIKSEEWTDGLYESGYNVSVWDCYKSFTPIGTAVVPENQQQEPQQLGIPDQTDLLREFEDVLTQTTGSLTPPESPKATQQVLINILEEINPGVSEIDQLVASEAEKQSIGVCSPPSSNGEPWSSPSSSQSDSGYDDPDWSPGDWSPSAQTETDHKIRSSRKTTTTEERKLRKKEQNKNAATRYRQKKKQEMEGIMGEEKGLQDENDRLKADITEVTREIRYLKSLMRDLFKAKGLIR